MFTGIIEEMGFVKNINMGSNSGVITIEANKVLENTMQGDSIAVNGVCLTVTGIRGNLFTADVMPETFKRSALGSLKNGSRVNLERAMSPMGRMGGHIVTGHIDTTGRIESIKKDSNAVVYKINIENNYLKYIVEKGSVAIDGISLTVVDTDNSGFRVSVIPHTEKETVLGYKKIGDTVNIECDIIGKYVEKLIIGAGADGSKSTSEMVNVSGERADTKNEGITLDKLKEYGF